MSIPHYVTETQKLQRVARDPSCRIKWTQHALTVMRDRNIVAADVIRVLTKGQVIVQEMKRDVLWRVEGKDVDGRPLEVVVAVFEGEITIKVITAF